MEKEMLEKVEDLLDDSLEIFTDKKNFAKAQNQTLKELAEKNGLEKSQLKRIMIYKYYSGKGWANSNPLEKDKESKVTDKLTPIFAKLRYVITDFVSIGAEDLLKPYFDELKKCGINVTFDDVPTLETNDSTETILETLDTACNYQTNIDTLKEELNENKSAESEDIGFTPKKSFSDVLSTFAKITEGKGDKVEDKIQDSIANSIMITNAFNYLNTKIEHDKS